MKLSRRTKISLAIFFLIIVTVNTYIIKKRNDARPELFSAAIQPGTLIDYPWAKAKKEILLWYIKPNCAICIENRERINQLAITYADNLEVKGICSEKYLAGGDTLKNYEFRFHHLDLEKYKALHLAFTPLAVMVENGKVTFSIQFDSPFPEEFQRLEVYLRDKYEK